MKLLKTFVASLAVFAFAFAMSADAACYTHISTLKQGSTGSQVMAMQSQLGIGADGKFGPMTKAAVMAFQASKGLTADGVVGPMTGAALAAACTTTTTPSTGGSTGSTGSTTLSGGAGEIDFSTTSTDVEDTVSEGEEDVKIFGMKADADGSDINISSIKVQFQNQGYASSSENFKKYVDEVKVFLGDEEVGSADASDFSKESGTPDTFSKTISLNGAIVNEDDSDKLYVAVSAKSSIDDTDQQNAEWDITVKTVRFNDATGAILSADVDGFDDVGDNDTFEFDDSSADDDIQLKASSSNPDDATVQVDENDSSDDILALVAKLDNDEDSSDASIMTIPVKVTLDNYGTDADTADNVIEKVVVEVDGDEYEADLSGAGTLNVDGTTPVTVTYNADVDGDTSVDSGDVVDVKVYITFNDQDGNYDQNTTVKAAIDNDDIDAENEDGDDMDVSGAERTGALLTLSTSGATISNIAWEIPTAGNLVDFKFKVQAEDGDIDIEIADIIAVDEITGNATVGTPTVTKISGDASGTTDDYVVADGDSATFRVRYAITGANGTFANIEIPQIAGQVIPEDDQISPTVTRNVNS